MIEKIQWVDMMQILVDEELVGWLSIYSSQKFYENVKIDVSNGVLSDDEITKLYNEATTTLIQNSGLGGGMATTLGYKLGTHAANAICFPSEHTDEEHGTLPMLIIIHIEVHETAELLAEFDMNMAKDYQGISRASLNGKNKEV